MKKEKSDIKPIIDCCEDTILTSFPRKLNDGEYYEYVKNRINTMIFHIKQYNREINALFQAVLRDIDKIRVDFNEKIRIEIRMIECDKIFLAEIKDIEEQVELRFLITLPIGIKLETVDNIKLAKIIVSELKCDLKQNEWVENDRQADLMGYYDD